MMNFLRKHRAMIWIVVLNIFISYAFYITFLHMGWYPLMGTVVGMAMVLKLSIESVRHHISQFNSNVVIKQIKQHGN